VYVEDCDALYNRAVRPAAKPKTTGQWEKMSDRYWRYGMRLDIMDPEG